MKKVSLLRSSLEIATRHVNRPIPFFLLSLLMLARAAFSMAAEGAPQTSTSGGITEISVERTRCYGSCPIDTLVLHADGKAEYMGKENTRLTGQFAGTFWSGDFDQLAKWLVAQGYFGLNASYGSQNVDTPSEVIRVTRGGERKSVINYSLGRSLQLWGMGNVIRAIAADIRWQPAGTGIRGQATWKPPGEDWRPQAEEYVWVDPEKQVVTAPGMSDRVTVRTDREGRFEVPLAAGTYRISSQLTSGNPQTVVVEANRFTQVNLRFEAAATSASANNLALPAGIPPPPPGDGLYVRALLTPAKWIFRKDNEMFLLGDKTEPTILAKQLESDSVDNSTFQLVLTTPYDATVTPVSRVLIIDGTAYDQTGSGSKGREQSLLTFQIPGEERAREVAKHFGVTIGHFSKPDYRFRVSLVPTKPSFKRGETVTATLRILNIGSKAVEFENTSFGDTRRDVYTFSALRKGQPVTDISFPRDRGGTAIPSIVLPGATFEDTVNLGRWFEFREAGSYSIHGVYKLNLRDSRVEARTANRSIQWPLVSWTENAETDFIVSIE